MNSSDPKTKSNRYFTQSRSEVLQFVPEGIENALEVGCGTGTFGQLLGDHFGINVWGVEPYEDAAISAEAHLQNVFRGTFDEYCSHREQASEEQNQQFEMLIYNDVLEHLVDPWETLRKSRDLLVPGGCVLASIPNVRYYRNMKKLIFGRDWKYVEKGILDRTHLRFFTRKSMMRMFCECGYSIERIAGINRARKFFPNALNVLTLGHASDILFTQFVVVARALPA